MHKSSVGLFGILFFNCISSASGTTWVIPRASEITAAGGAHYSTDVKILNRGAAPANVMLEFVPPVGVSAPAAIMQQIAPGQTLVLTDVLGSMWGLAETVGGIEIVSDQVLLIQSRTYNNANPPGTYGYTEQAAALTDLPNAGQRRHAIWVSQSADPTKGASTTVGALLLTPDASVSVALFDASSNVVGGTTFSGGVGLQEAALSTLTQADLPIARVEFDVTSGQAAPYAIVTANVSGDPTSIPAVSLASGTTDVVFANLAKANASQAQSWRSDLRMISTSGRPASVQATVVSASASSLIGMTQSIPLNPGQIVEIQDVLGALFSAPDGTTATVELQCPSAVMMLARTAYSSTDATPGGFGYLQTPGRVAGYLAAPETATLIGLRQDTSAPGAVTTVGAAAGTDGFTADIMLSDASGNVLGVIPGGLSAPPMTTVETPIGALFPNVNIADNSRLDITPQTGEAMVYAKNADVTTNDVDVSVASVPEPGYCPAPTVISFVASPATLLAAGSVQLSWYASGATSVQIDQGVGGGGAAGSATVAVSQGTTYNLTAQNDCGTTTGSVGVTVGAPVVSGLSATSPTPGQTVTLSLGNIADLTTVTSAMLACGSAAPRQVNLGTDGSGNVTLVVPIVADASFPGGSWSGSCTLSVVTASGQTAPYSFTIAPPAFPGDPVAAFKTLVANIQQEAHAQFGAQAGTSAAGQVTGALEPLIDQWVAQLNQMADDISASGTASLPVDVPVPPAPAPPMVTVTRADVMQFVSFLNASVPALFTPINTQQLRLKPRGELPPPGYLSDGSSACLIRDPQLFTFSGSLAGMSTTFGQVYASCVQAADPFSKIMQVGLQMIAQSALTAVTILSAPVGPKCQLPALGDPLGWPMLVLQISRLANSAAILCNLTPTTFVSFVAQPTPPQTFIPLGSLESTGNVGTHLFANMTTNFGFSQEVNLQQNLGYLLASNFENALLAQAQQNQCSQDTLVAIAALYQPLVVAENYLAGTFIHDYASAFPLTVKKEVYKCDLISVEPVDKSALHHRDDRENQTVPPYYFEGLKVGPTQLQVTGYDTNFILPTAGGLIAPPAASAAPPAQLQDFLDNNRATISVETAPTLSVYQQNATVYSVQTPETGSFTTTCSPPVLVTSTGGFTAYPGGIPPAACIPSASPANPGFNEPLPNSKDGTAPAGVKVTSLGNNMWKVDVDAGATRAGLGIPDVGKAVVEVLASNPAPFGEKSSVVIDGTTSLGPVSGVFAAGEITISDSNGKTVTDFNFPGDSPPSFPITVDSTCSVASPDCSTTGPVDIYIGLASTGNLAAGQNVDFTVSFTIQFLNAVPPAQQLEIRRTTR